VPNQQPSLAVRRVRSRRA